MRVPVPKGVMISGKEASESAGSLGAWPFEAFGPFDDLGDIAGVDEPKDICDALGAPFWLDAASLGALEDMRLEVRSVEQKREASELRLECLTQTVAPVREGAHLCRVREPAVDSSSKELARDGIQAVQPRNVGSVDFIDGAR